MSIGAKSVLGQECTISAYQHVSIGRECIIADRVMMIDFDHGMVEVERPIREQGIYKRDVNVGHNVWIGYGACVLRGVTVGDNSVIGTSAVVTADVPANAVVGGDPGPADPDARGAAARSAGGTAGGRAVRGGRSERGAAGGSGRGARAVRAGGARLGAGCRRDKSDANPERAV